MTIQAISSTVLILKTRLGCEHDNASNFIFGDIVDVEYCKILMQKEVNLDYQSLMSDFDGKEVVIVYTSPCGDATIYTATDSQVIDTSEHCLSICFNELTKHP